MEQMDRHSIAQLKDDLLQVDLQVCLTLGQLLVARPFIPVVELGRQRRLQLTNLGEVGPKLVVKRLKVGVSFVDIPLVRPLRLVISFGLVEGRKRGDSFLVADANFELDVCANRTVLPKKEIDGKRVVFKRIL